MISLFGQFTLISNWILSGKDFVIDFQNKAQNFRDYCSFEEIKSWLLPKYVLTKLDSISGIESNLYNQESRIIVPIEYIEEFKKFDPDFIPHELLTPKEWKSKIINTPKAMNRFLVEIMIRASHSDLFDYKYQGRNYA